MWGAVPTSMPTYAKPSPTAVPREWNARYRCHLGTQPRNKATITGSITMLTTPVQMAQVTWSLSTHALSPTGRTRPSPETTKATAPTTGVVALTARSSSGPNRT